MHKGPQGQKRPADVIGNAVRVKLRHYLRERTLTGTKQEHIFLLSPAAASLADAAKFC
jgi:hypothetical protein